MVRKNLSLDVATRPVTTQPQIVAATDKNDIISKPGDQDQAMSNGDLSNSPINLAKMRAQYSVKQSSAGFDGSDDHFQDGTRGNSQKPIVIPSAQISNACSPGPIAIEESPTKDEHETLENFTGLETHENL